MYLFCLQPQARARNFTEEEKMVILRYMQSHKKELLGKAGRPGHGDDKVFSFILMMYDRDSVSCLNMKL